VLMGRTRFSPARHIRHVDFLREDVFPAEFSDGAAGRNYTHCGNADRVSHPRVPAARHSSGNRSADALGPPRVGVERWRRVGVTDLNHRLEIRLQVLL
jgi:hypothetical protein